MTTELLLNLFMITCITVCITDKTDIWDNINKAILQIIYKNDIKHNPNILPKIFRCSLCQTWWLCLAYCIIYGSFNVECIFVSIMLAIFAEDIGNVITFLKDVLVGIFKVITDKLYND